MPEHSIGLGAFSYFTVSLFISIAGLGAISGILFFGGTLNETEIGPFESVLINLEIAVLLVMSFYCDYVIYRMALLIFKKPFHNVEKTIKSGWIIGGVLVVLGVTLMANVGHLVLESLIGFVFLLVPFLMPRVLRSL